jgi:hypothetical protein
MIVSNFHIGRSVVASRPFKTNAPLVIDADAKLALSVASKDFQAVAPQGSQVLKRLGGIQGLKSFFGLLSEGLKSGNSLATGKALGPPVSVASDYT